MKKQYRTVLLLMTLFFFCLLPAREAEAASAKKLFSIVINDGYAIQTVPVYQYADGQIAAKKALRTLNVYASAKTASVSITGKTSLYRSIGKSIRYQKKITLKSAVVLKYRVTLQDGSQKEFQIKVKRPAMPKITSLTTSPKSSAGFVTGASAKMKIQLKYTSTVAVKAYYRIFNAQGKAVYTRILGTKKGGTFSSYWNGKPSAKNAAGLSTADYVPAGTYKLTGFLCYTVGEKTRYIKKTASITVKAAETETTPEATVETGNWNWKVILTGDDDLDYRAEQICRQTVTNSMTELQRATALFRWCSGNMTYVSWHVKTPSYTQSKDPAVLAKYAAYGKIADALIAQGKASVNNHNNWYGSSTKWFYLPKYAMTSKTAGCSVMALTYLTLCRHAGITAEIVRNDGSAGEHYWNVVKINGKYYYADVNQGVNTYSNGSFQKAFFLCGTTFINQYPLYSTVVKSAKYPEVSLVSKTDCPGR